jgi:cell division protein FtsL
MSIWAATLPQGTETASAQLQLRRYMPGAPEIYFAKAIDNSRLVKVADPRRRREMKVFGVVLTVLLGLVMVYLCQHFSAIDCGYKIEKLRSERDVLNEANRALKLEEASLRDPGRIDALAKSMGLQMPQAGQVQALDASTLGGGPELARATGVSVISLPD